MLAKAPRKFKACSGIKVLLEAPGTPWYSPFRLAPRAAPGSRVQARRTLAARFPPTSSGASGAKPHPDASCPSRPTTTSKLGPWPPSQGGTGHTKDEGGAGNKREVVDGRPPEGRHQDFDNADRAPGGPTAPTRLRPRSRQP